MRRLCCLAATVLTGVSARPRRVRRSHLCRRPPRRRSGSRPATPPACSRRRCATDSIPPKRVELHDTWLESSWFDAATGHDVKHRPIGLERRAGARVGGSDPARQQQGDGGDGLSPGRRSLAAPSASWTARCRAIIRWPSRCARPCRTWSNATAVRLRHPRRPVSRPRRRVSRRRRRTPRKRRPGPAAELSGCDSRPTTGEARYHDAKRGAGSKACSPFVSP